MSLDAQTREKIYSRVCKLVTRKHFNPGMNGANWEELSKSWKDKILQSSSDEEFEKQMQELLNELKTSHTGFRHSKSPNLPGRHAIIYETPRDLTPLPPNGAHSVWSAHLAIFDLTTHEETSLTSGITNNVQATLCSR